MSFSLDRDPLSPEAIDSSWADWCALVEESNQLRQLLMQVQHKHHRQQELAQQQLYLMRDSHVALASYCSQLRAEIERLDPANRLADPALQPGGPTPIDPQEAMLRQCFYVSRARVGAEAVQPMWASCVRRNAGLELTGMLLFTGRHFAQLIEGEPQVVDATLARIKADPRHAQLRVLLDKPLAQRSCAPGRLALMQLQELDGIAAQLLAAEKIPPGAADKLLAVMREREARQG